MLFAAFLACCLIACTKEIEYPGEKETDFGEAEDSSVYNMEMTIAGMDAGGSLRSLDLVFFNEDALMRLDSYQHIDGKDIAGNRVTGASRAGRKRLVAIANGDSLHLTREDISSWHSLKSRLVMLSNENPDQPLMCGEAEVDADADTKIRMELKPLTGRIRVETLSCDFHERPYDGAKLEDVRVYLTNVKASCMLLDKEASGGTIINHGHLNEPDLQNFSHKDMIVRSLPNPIGIGVTKAGIDLFCYPDTNSNESIGTPFTRLVVEGTLLGQKYYYPIDINRNDSVESGIRGGTSYVFNITVTGRGTDDPDKPLTREHAMVQMQVKPWNECGNVTIKYRSSI